MAKKEIYFFTDPALLDAPESGSLNKQIETDSFGSVNGTGTKFLCCSVHKSNNAVNPPAYAITSGRVAVYEHSDGIHATLVLKPSVQPGELKMNDLPSVKFYIYRGVLLSSVIDGVSVAAQGTGNDMIDYIWDKYQETGVPPKESILLYQNNTNPLETPISASFENKASGEAPYFELNAGKCIGKFSASGFSVEIIFDDYDYEPELSILAPEDPGNGDPLDYIRHHITAEPLVNVDRFLSFIQRNEREEVLHYLDPAAFYGSLYFTKVHYRIGSSDEKDETDVFYNIATTKFFNKNVLYLDIRNNHNKSFNYYNFLESSAGVYEAGYGYYPRYKDEVNIGMEQDTSSVYFSTAGYYSNGWPLKKITPPPALSANATNKNVYKIALAHDRLSTRSHDYKQMIYVANGFINSGTKFSKRSPKADERFVDLSKDSAILYPSSSFYFGPFEIPVPNLASGSQAKPVCWYTRLYYLRQTQEKFTDAIRKNLVPDPQYFLDYAFDPVAMNKKTENLVYKNFRTATYIDLKPENTSQGDFTGSIGIAKDSTYTSLFIIPEHSRFSILDDASAGISDSGGKITPGKNFLEHVDQKNLFRSISIGTLKLQETPLIERKHYALLNKFGFRNYSGLGLTLLIMQNSNWETVMDFIQEKFDNQELHEDLGVTFVIKDRNDANEDAIDNKDLNDEPYLFFQLYVKGFRSLANPTTPADLNSVDVVEFDLGLKFYGKKDKSSGKLSTIFVEDNITNSLLLDSPEELKCPELKLNLNDDARTEDYIDYPLNDNDIDHADYDVDYSDTQVDEMLARITELSSAIFKEDLVDFITEITQDTYEQVNSTTYKIKSGEKHNLFLIYQHVWSKMIVTETDEKIMRLHLTSKDTASGGNVKVIYGGADDASDVLKTYNFHLPILDSGKVQLKFDPVTNEIAGGEDVENQGFFLEAAYTFAMWKLGKTMHQIYRYLRGLRESDIESKLVYYFEQLAAISPFYKSLEFAIEQNKVQPPHKLFEDGKFPPTATIKEFIDAYAVIFKDNLEHGKGLAKIFDSNGYLSKIKLFNDFTIPTDGASKQKFIADISLIKRNYLHDVIYKTYERLGGTGKYSAFYNFRVSTGAGTSHIFDNRAGIFFMDVFPDANGADSASKTISFELQRSADNGTVAIVHFGLYGIDQSTFAECRLKGYKHKRKGYIAAGFSFGDEFYRVSRGYTGGFTTAPDYTIQPDNIWRQSDPAGDIVLGSFNPETGDFTITNQDVEVLYFTFPGTDNDGINELHFNTICVSEIPASSMFTFAKAFPDLFTDDVFQLSSGQLADIWDFSSDKEKKNIDRLIDILYTNDAKLNVDMTGGFIGKLVLPSLHVSGKAYKAGDRVTFIAAGNDPDTSETETDYIDIYTALTNTSSSPGSSSWQKQPRYSSSGVYQKGDFLSDGTFIYKCLEDNTSVELYYTQNWEVAGQKYDSKKVFNYDDKVIVKDGNGVHHYYRCAANNISDDLSSIYWLVESIVESDERYAFNPDNNLVPFELAEVEVPPAGSSLTADQFARVRYAYACIEWSLTDNAINIHIEAYASPLISRLDRVMTDNTKPVSLVNYHTLYGQDPTVGAFIERSPDPDIPSYNQLLTALRCWGMLEGIKSRIQTRTASEFPERSTKIQAKLTEMLNSAHVKTTFSNGYPDIADREINDTNYGQIKL